LVGYAAAEPVAADPAALPGLYDCRGTGADGKPYRGAVIIDSDGDRFVLRWIISEQLTAIGVGVRDRDMLAVSFFGAEPGGVVLYRIEGERLIGHWSAPLAAGLVFEETLTRVAHPESLPSPPPATKRPSDPRRPPRSIRFVQPASGPERTVGTTS
jgi:hypothetical protein